MAVPDEITKLIKNSGNNFHAKVARWFSTNGWHIVVSPYYMDQAQNKAREIDLVAEKLWPVKDRFKNQMGHIAVRLFIECKYVSQHSVFWFAEKDHESAQDLVCSTGPFQPNNKYTDKHHHYLLAQNSKVAKLFATSTNKAPENDPFYKALNQVLSAMVSMRGLPVSVPELKKSQMGLQAIMQFPVVVCNSLDKIYSVDFYTESEPKPIKENFQLEVRYAYIDRQGKRRNEYFLLDFVEFSQLEKFVAVIDEDAKAAAILASTN